MSTTRLTSAKYQWSVSYFLLKTLKTFIQLTTATDIYIHANASMCLRGEGKELLGKRFSLLQLTVGSFRSFSFDFMCLELWRMGCIDASCGAFQTAVRTRDLHIVQLYMAPPASQFRNVMPIVNQAIKLHGESLGSFRAMSANPPASLHRKLSPHRKHELRMP